MFPRLVPATATASALAFVVAAGSVALVPEYPWLWDAAVALVILGAITPLIYAVNARIVPVFSRRAWQSPRTLAAGMVLAVSGGWLTFLGRAVQPDLTEIVASAVALVSGLLFVARLIRLLRSPVTTAAGPPLPYAEHSRVDRIGIRFTGMAIMYLLRGLAVGLTISLWTPDRGRWDLVWAHALLLGWFMNMASGVSYHVLARWTGRRWRRPRLLSLHLWLTKLALPLMLIALAVDNRWLLALGGSLQAAALLIYAVNILPMFPGLPAASRIGMTAATILLTLGVLIGASFALDPANHVRLRLSHATINLFGFAGLLVVGVGYYLFPRFAG